MLANATMWYAKENNTVGLSDSLHSGSCEPTGMWSCAIEIQHSENQNQKQKWESQAKYRFG